MPHRRHELAVRHLVAGELVSDDHPGHLPQALEQSAEELLGGHRVSARLDQNVEHGAVLVDRAPQVPLCAVDLDEHLIQVPFVARPPTTTARLVSVLLPEPLAPGPDRLIGHVDTTFEHQFRRSSSNVGWVYKSWYSHPSSPSSTRRTTAICKPSS